MHGGLAQKQNSPTLTQDNKGDNSHPILAPREDRKTSPNQQGSCCKPPPWWQTPEGWLAILGIPTLALLYWQAQKTHEAASAAKLSAEATAKQVGHLINSERPFILVYTKGAKGTEIWIRNCGRSPAQLLFIDPVMKLGFPEFDEAEQEFVMKQPPFYGKAYESGEQYNVAWLAPGAKRYFATFDPAIFGEIPSETREELNRGIRQFRIYSAIKYRGTISHDIYETRFCYGWGPSGLYMTGPYGYNQNT